MRSSPGGWRRQGIVFIGPKHYSMAAMGDKIASKKLAREAKVNTIPGYNEPIETPEQAVADRPSGSATR